MHNHGAPYLLDIAVFVLPVIRPILDATLRARRNRRGRRRQHWRYGIADYRQATQSCNAMRDSPFWHEAFRQMWREMKGDLQDTLGITLSREPPLSYDDMPMVAKQQLAIDNRHARSLSLTHGFRRTHRETRALVDLMTRMR